MKTGSSGTFVISWSQSELDGMRNAPVSGLSVGAAWRWTGDAISVDGTREVLLLENALGADELRARAARNVRRMLGEALEKAPEVALDMAQDRLFDGAFDVTDGHALFTVTIIDLPQIPTPLLMFIGATPPKDVDLWIVAHQSGVINRDLGSDDPRGVICFTPGTRIATPDGPRLVEDLGQGDKILTKDNGPQELAWIGSRRLSGARLYALPALRPIRLRASALGIDVPDGDLIVSPQHRMVVRGAFAQELFSTDEVLISAGDLVNDHSILVDHTLREVTYIHLMLEAHQIVFANGVETESFHPLGAEMSMLGADQRNRLRDAFPQVEQSPDAYGAFARRALSGAEAAILRHAMA